jgi:hypothetical protein
VFRLEWWFHEDFIPCPTEIDILRRRFRQIPRVVCESFGVVGKIDCGLGKVNAILSSSITTAFGMKPLLSGELKLVKTFSSPKYVAPSRIQLYIRQPFLRLLPRSLIPTLSLFAGPITMKASTIHSYQTFLSSVCLQILTSNSASSG